MINKSRKELDAIYKSAIPGSIPTGDTKGTAIVTWCYFPKLIAWFIKLFIWKGKVFTPSGNGLVNKITFFGFKTIKADVFIDKSWMDNKDTIVIDYSKTSFFFQKVRDEIRLVVPGIYLGKVWIGKLRILDFILEV